MLFRYVLQLMHFLIFTEKTLLLQFKSLNMPAESTE